MNSEVRVSYPGVMGLVEHAPCSEIIKCYLCAEGNVQIRGLKFMGFTDATSALGHLRPEQTACARQLAMTLGIDPQAF